MKQAYVTADGSYGGEDILLFDPDTLNDNQWEMLTQMAIGLSMFMLLETRMM